MKKDYDILIKKPSNMSTVSEIVSQCEDKKFQKNHEQARYTDEYESDSMKKLEHCEKPVSKKREKKWYGKAWDLYRALENHKRSGIFYEPYIPQDIDSISSVPSFQWAEAIKYPITLKTIGLQLKLDIYSSMGEFSRDLQCMFDNSRKYLTNKKLLKDLKSIEKHLSF